MFVLLRLEACLPMYCCQRTLSVRLCRVQSYTGPPRVASMSPAGPVNCSQGWEILEGSRRLQSSGCTLFVHVIHRVASSNTQSPVTHRPSLGCQSDLLTMNWPSGTKLPWVATEDEDMCTHLIPVIRVRDTTFARTVPGFACQRLLKAWSFWDLNCEAQPKSVVLS